MKRQNTNNIYYVYLHKRRSNGEIFYIGKGKGNRCFIKFGRNLHWKNIVNSEGYIIEIYKSNLSEKESLDLEVKLISIYKPICNFTNGGDGVKGFEINEETKEKFRAAKIGKKQSPEHAAKSRIARLGKKNTSEHTEKVISLKRKKIINSDGEIFNSANEATRVMSLRLNIKCSQGNISNSARGVRSVAYGLSWSYDVSKVPELLTPKTPEKTTCLIEKNITFKSVMQASKWICENLKINAKHQYISESARSNGVKSAYGFHWKYI